MMDAATLNLAFQVIGWIVGIVGFCIIKFNDFSHLEKSQSEIKASLDKNTETISELSAKIAKVEGKLGL